MLMGAARWEAGQRQEAGRVLQRRATFEPEGVGGVEQLKETGQEGDT